ncbi:MAG: TonB-dependent receptor [Chitinophagaceae bacterium]|nr:TonB-dependent receptor [Bacteroidota bacterium]MCC6258333.1 TonB-dependent receptor [Chitinophagaceae bacterium]MCW5916801.1 TonB-dependent receptor [Ferruginibacter sp.]
MKKTFFLAFLMLGIFQAAKAQNGRIEGSLMDQGDSSSIRSATVSLLLQSDSSIVTNTVSGNKGVFSFSNLAPGNYIVQVNALDYQEYLSFISLSTTSPNKNLGRLPLVKKGKDLAVVTIIAKAPAVTQKGDTSQFSASEYKVNPDATTEDLIKKMPGITVAKDGTVTAQGDQVKKVTIDGKDFFGDDASAALRNLPSEVVDKIQVFDRLSDQAQLTGIDDGNSVKAINVVTKTGVKNGQFGRIYGGYGTDNRYMAGGNVSFFNNNRRISLVGNFNNVNQQNFGSQDLLGLTSSGGRGGGGGGFRGGGNNFLVGQQNGISSTNAFGINYNDLWGKKLKVSGSYFFNNSHNNNESLVKTETVGDYKQFITQDGNTTTNNNNHRLNMRLEYNIDSSNTLIMVPSISFQSNNSYGNSSLQTLNGLSDSVNNSLVRSDADRNGYNISNNLYFRHAFPKKGRSINLGFNLNLTKNDGDYITDGRYRYYDNSGGFLSDSTQNQHTNSNSNSRSFGGSIDYTEPLSKNSLLQFEYRPSVQYSKADQEAYLYDGSKYSLFDSTLSNLFNNTITTHRGGITYRYSKGRDVMFFAGLNYQQSRLESDRTFPTATNVDQKFSNFLPIAMYRKKISAYSNIRLFYRASVNFPSVTQLQDVLNLSNPLSVSSGNPQLKQSYNHFLMARYSFTNTKTNKSLFANIYLQAANNYISNAVYIATADSTIQHGVVLKKGSQLTKPVNLNGYQSLRSFFTYSMPIKPIKTTLNLNAGFSYSRLPGQVNYMPTTTNNYVYNAGVVLASNISQYVDFNLSYNVNFNNAQTKSILATNSNYVNQVAGLQVNLLSKNGWFIQNDVSNQTNSGLASGLNQNFWLWNAGIGKKFLKKQAGELKLSVFDLLGQNQSISRSVTESYIQDTRSTVLQRYFMLTFTYSLRNFGKGKASGGNQGGFYPGGGHGGPGPGPGGMGGHGF